jgi:hypothetical protein
MKVGEIVEEIFGGSALSEVPQSAGQKRAPKRLFWSNFGRRSIGKTDELQSGLLPYFGLDRIH